MREGDMTRNATSSRRSFLKGGAVLAAPLAVAVPAAFIADDGLKARLARLEDEAAVRELHQTWMRRINTGAGDAATTPLFANREGTSFNQALRSIAPDHAGQPDAIEIAADGKNAAGRFPSTVELETRIAQDCTLARMAHAQGGGFVRRTERRVLKVEYVKASGVWAIARVEFQNGPDRAT
jgi:TAT (twin-arginine translocation) pathway-exported protein